MSKKLEEAIKRNMIIDVMSELWHLMLPYLMAASSHQGHTGEQQLYYMTAKYNYHQACLDCMQAFMRESHVNGSHVKDTC